MRNTRRRRRWRRERSDLVPFRVFESTFPHQTKAPLNGGAFVLHGEIPDEKHSPMAAVAKEEKRPGAL